MLSSRCVRIMSVGQIGATELFFLLGIAILVFGGRGYARVCAALSDFLVEGPDLLPIRYPLTTPEF